MNSNQLTAIFTGLILLTLIVFGVSYMKEKAYQDCLNGAEYPSINYFDCKIEHGR